MEKIICEKCGSEMKTIKEGLSIGMLCPKCSWGWVTTNTDHILLDSKIYTITIEGSLVPKMDEIRFVSKHTGCNYIEARKKTSARSFCNFGKGS